MRFPISYNQVSRVLLTMIGMPQSQAYAEVTADTVTAKLGWSGSITMPRAAISSVEKINRVPLGLGLGMHGNFRGAWAMNGASTGAVKIAMSRPASGRVIVFAIRPTTIYLSLEDPDGFVNALSD